MSSSPNIPYYSSMYLELSSVKPGPSLGKKENYYKRCLVNFYFVTYSQTTITSFKTVISQTLLSESLGELYQEISL